MVGVDGSLVCRVGHFDLIAVAVGEVAIESSVFGFGLQFCAGWNREDLHEGVGAPDAKLGDVGLLLAEEFERSGTVRLLSRAIHHEYG